MPVFQVVNYHSQTKLYQGIFGLIKTNVAYKFMLRVVLELNFVNTIFPSGGVSGFSYFSIRLKPKGISTAQSTLANLVKNMAIYVSFQILLIIGLLMLAIDGRASGLLILVAGSLVTLSLIGTFLFAYIIGSKSRINDFLLFLTKAINKLVHIISRRPETISLSRAQRAFSELHENYRQIRSNFSDLYRPLGYALFANLAEVMTIYVVYLAFGYWVNPGAIIIAYAVANFAGFISVLPGGVGIYEFLMTAILTAGGVPASLSIPVTVMYRVLNMTIQLIPGYVLYHKALRENSNARS